MPVMTRSQAKALTKTNPQDARVATQNLSIERHPQLGPSAPIKISDPQKVSSQSSTSKRKAEAPIDADRCRRSRVSADEVDPIPSHKSTVTTSSNELIEQYPTNGHENKRSSHINHRGTPSAANDLLATDDPSNNDQVP